MLEKLNVIGKVTFGGVLHVRTEDEKKGYKGPLFYAHPGDLVISKIRVAQGSLCVVPESLAHLAVSAEYPVYTVDHSKVSADFIRLVIRTGAFRHRVARLRSGNTSKARIRPADFEALTIPLPSLQQQQDLQDAYAKALKKAEKLEADAELTERTSRIDFEQALGVASPPPLPNRPVFVASFREIERWSHDGILRGTCMSTDQVSQGATVQLDEVLTEVRHGCSAGPSKQATKLRVLKISAVTKGRLDLDEFKYLADSATVRETFNLRAGDILMCRTNGTIQYVGMSALVERDVEATVFPDKVIRVRVDKSRVLPAFLWRLLQTPAIRRQIEGAARTAVGNFAIGGADIRALMVPLPPLKEQMKLAEALNDAKARVAKLRDEADAVRRSAWSTFEKALFQSDAS